MPNHCGNQGDGEVRSRKDIAEGEGQRLPLSVGPVELSHQQVCIKEEDYKRDLDQGAKYASERPATF